MSREEIRARRKQREAAEKAEKKARAEKIRACMKYRAIINIDFTSQNVNEYQRLIAAFMQIKWKYLETSAFVFEGDLPNIFSAMELISKQCQAAGILSALTFHIQGSTNFDGKPYRKHKNYPYALDEIRNKPLLQSAMSNAPDATQQS
jgi:hypothetical protein